jgi:hypothetical protein
MLTLANFHDYQWVGLEHLHLHPFCGLYYDAGLGKTAIGLTYLKHRLMLGTSKRAIVIAPIRVAIQTWPNELAEWEHLVGTDYQLIRAEDDDILVKQAYKDAYTRARSGGLTREEAEMHRDLCRASLEKQWIDYWTAGLSPVFPQPMQIEQFEMAAANFMFLALNGHPLPVEEANRAAGTITTAFKDRLRRQQARSKAPLHFINREALPWLVQFLKDERSGFPYDDAIYDEASDLGDQGTSRFKAMRELRRPLKSFVQMTATPAAEGYGKLFSQRWLMDKGKLWGNAITPWRDDHFTYNSKKFSYMLRKGHDKIISSQIADLCLVAKGEDHLPSVATGWADLTRKIELGPELREREREFIESRILRLSDETGTDIPDDFIDADNPASLSQKLLQFCSGAVYDDKKVARAIHDHKIEELRQLIDELHGEPIMLVYWWQSSLARLRKAFPKMVVMDTKGSQQEAWNKGKINLMALHPQGSEFGLNLQKGPGHDICIFDMFWSYEKWYQIHKRLARQGQTRPVRSWPLVVKGSADEVAVQRLQQKENAQNALFKYIMAMKSGLSSQEAVNGKETDPASYADAFD